MRLRISMKKRGVYALVLLCASSLQILVADEGEIIWTRSYRKNFSVEEQQEYDTQFQCTFERTQVVPFSQLIFSWNALRPVHGSLIFWAQIRDRASQHWGSWHRMMSWGPAHQKSYEDKKKNRNVSSYHFVRLEVETGSLADGFKIRIESEQGARLSAVRSFVVSVTNLEAFVPEKVNDIKDLSSVMVKGVPTISQFMLDHSQADRLCSPTSCTMVSSFLAKKSISPLLFADSVYDEGLGVYGSWPFNTAQMYEALQGKASAFVVRMNSFKQVHAQLKRGMPVIVSVRGFLHGAPKSYDNGHLLVVVGWDALKGEVICNDPAQKADAEVQTGYSIRDFIAAWERSRRLAYLIMPERLLES